MTIKNNSFSDILNDFKKNQSGQENQQIKPEEAKKMLITSIAELSSSVLLLLFSIIKSFIFGYALKTLFNADWNIWQFLCVGFTLNFIFQFIYNLIHS